MTTELGRRRNPALSLLISVTIMVALSGCGGSDGGQETGTSGTTSSSSDGTTPSTAPKPDADSESNATVPVLDHEEALAAGFDHTTAITCGYTYDEEELVGIRMLAQTDDVPTEATIYVDRGAIYWDIPQPDGRMSHMLALDGSLYTWKVPEDSDGVKSPDATNGGGDDLKARMSRNAHDCTVYDGPASIFQPPNDIIFQSVE